MLLRLFARFYLWVGRWRLEGEKPDHPKYVIIAYPHTSNWDFIYMKFCASIMGIELSWMGKKELFSPRPWGWFMKWLGGVPIDRSAAHGVVGEMVQALKNADALVLGVPASGTRRKTEHWRSGFYHIARQADVPIVLSDLDYGRKRARMGKVIMPTGDIVKDMETIRKWYGDTQGRDPSKMTPIRLREEAP